MLKILNVAEPDATLLKVKARQAIPHVFYSEYTGLIGIRSNPQMFLHHGYIADPDSLKGQALKQAGITNPEIINETLGYVIAVAVVVECVDYARAHKEGLLHHIEFMFDAGSYDFYFLLEAVRPLDRPVAVRHGYRFYDATAEQEEMILSQIRTGKK